METARIDLDTMQRQLHQAADAVAALSRSLSDIGGCVVGAYASSTVGEQWARTWGETLSKKRAAEMLGVSVTYLRGMVDDGRIACAPDGRVLTRSAAEWANSVAPPKRKTRFRV